MTAFAVHSIIARSDASTILPDIISNFCNLRVSLITQSTELSKHYRANIHHNVGVKAVPICPLQSSGCSWIQESLYRLGFGEE